MSVTRIDAGRLLGKTPSELRDQEAVNHGAITALQELVRRGVDRANADAMLRELVRNQRLVRLRRAEVERAAREDAP